MRESSKANRRARDRRGLELFWNQVDDDGSGTLERGELDILMIKMGMVLNRKQKREAMAAMDDDGSGCISFAEFEAWWKARRPGATGAEVNSTMLERSLADRRPVSLPEIYRG
jgi:Ca2+-binding EF-hand superfamily protein